MSHTPGPWAVSVDGIVYSGTPGAATEIAFVAQQTDGMSAIEAKHNGNLIAAAPQLLKALRELTAVNECWCSPQCGPCYRCNALAVIGKLDG